MPAPPAVDDTCLRFQSALAGRYAIDRELGRGGMGIVYLAHEIHLDRLVAIKLLPPERAADPVLRERFLREARVAARLSHPHIIPIHAVAEEGGFVFFVMAYIDGETLAQRVRTRGPLVGADAVRVFREVAWALAHAHAQGLVHRDVKPDNILIEASTGRALVADFGIAAAMGDTSGHGVAGTPEFMSPEQAAGVSVDARSDLYSLGATAFYACSGSLPFEGSTATEILARAASAPAPSLGTLGVPVPRKLIVLVDRCLSKDPDQRPETAEVLAEQLGLALQQRRELPAALRAFVKRTSRLNGAGTIIAAGGLLTGAISIGSIYGARAGFGSLVVGAAAGKMGFFINAARKLLRQGFTHADVGPAFQREREQASEELAVAGRPIDLRIARALKWSAIAGFSAGAIGLVGVIAAELSFRQLIEIMPMGARALMRVSSMLFAYGMAGGSFSVLGYLAVVQRHRDVDTDIWARLWTGTVGKTAFAIARRLMRRPPAISAMTHRATELSLGLAAEQLFETLPKDTRNALHDVPDVTRRLQDDARLLRERLEHLNASVATASDDERDEVTRLRDDAQRRLGDVVGALETIRLNLLRLHAGQASVASLTTHLSIAAEVSDQVARLVAAHGEVEQVLQFPRETAATPA